MTKYITVKGEEFATWQAVGVPKATAQIIKRKTIEDMSRILPLFPLKIKLVKRKDGYYVFTNNTVHNINEWERTGKIPKRG